MGIYIKHINSTQIESNQINYRCQMVKRIDDLVGIRYSYKELCMLLLYRGIVSNINNLRKKKMSTSILGIGIHICNLSGAAART